MDSSHEQTTSNQCKQSFDNGEQRSKQNNRLADSDRLKNCLRRQSTEFIKLGPREGTKGVKTKRGSLGDIKLKEDQIEMGTNRIFICKPFDGKSCDKYCWFCHKIIIYERPKRCSSCPRSFHTDCLVKYEETNQTTQKTLQPLATQISPTQSHMSLTQTWTSTPEFRASTSQSGTSITQLETSEVCIDCAEIRMAEDEETKLPTLKISIEDTNACFEYTIYTIQYNAQDHIEMTSSYSEIQLSKLINPVDLDLIEKRIKEVYYHSPRGFLNDVKWYHHNMHILYPDKKNVIKQVNHLLDVARNECHEIELCPDCYWNYYHDELKTGYFHEVCLKPHTLVWARLKSGPKWPAKVFQIISSNEIDVRFFGSENKAIIPPENITMLSCDSKKNPNYTSSSKGKTRAMNQLKKHINLLNEKFLDLFQYHPINTPFNMKRYLKDEDNEEEEKYLQKFKELDSNKTIINRTIKEEIPKQDDLTESDKLIIEKSGIKLRPVFVRVPRLRYEDLSDYNKLFLNQDKMKKDSLESTTSKSDTIIQSYISSQIDEKLEDQNEIVKNDVQKVQDVVQDVQDAVLDAQDANKQNAQTESPSKVLKEYLTNVILKDTKSTENHVLKEHVLDSNHFLCDENNPNKEDDKTSEQTHVQEVLQNLEAGDKIVLMDVDHSHVSSDNVESTEKNQCQDEITSSAITNDVKMSEDIQSAHLIQDNVTNKNQNQNKSDASSIEVNSAQTESTQAQVTTIRSEEVSSTEISSTEARQTEINQNQVEQSEARVNQVQNNKVNQTEVKKNEHVQNENKQNDFSYDEPSEVGAANSPQVNLTKTDSSVVSTSVINSSQHRRSDEGLGESDQSDIQDGQIESQNEIVVTRNCQVKITERITGTKEGETQEKVYIVSNGVHTKLIEETEHLTSNCITVRRDEDQELNLDKVNGGEDSINPISQTAEIVPQLRKARRGRPPKRYNQSKVERETKRLKIDGFENQIQIPIKDDCFTRTNNSSAQLIRTYKERIEALEQENENLKREIKESKLKQWCRVCLNEAILHCCWNTSYCNVKCQYDDWPRHMRLCRRRQRNAQQQTQTQY